MTAGTASSALDLSVHSQRVVGASSRLALLDGVRLLAAAGIVWVHAASSPAGMALSPVGTFGVPFYIFVACLFMARGLAKDPEKTVAGYIVSRFFRVYIPFLFWSAVYVLLAEMKSIAVAHTFHLPPWTTLYAGGHMHLWFLPFLMAVTIIGACLVRGLQSRPWARKIVIGLLVASGAGLMMMPEPAWVSTRELAGDMEFWRFAFRAAPTSCLALALALCTAINGRLPRTTPILAAGGAFLLISALLTESALDASKILRALAGFGCLLVALLPVGMPLIERIGRYGRYSYGVYLSHVVFLRLVVLWIEHHHVAPSLLVDVLSFAFAFTAAFGLSVLLGQSKYTRWALGE